LLTKPPQERPFSKHSTNSEEIAELTEKPKIGSSTLTFREKCLLLLPLLPYMIPLAVVYFMEYAINTGIQPAMTFDSSIAYKDQYIWYQLLYQFGVFFSRSSVNLFSTHNVWIFAVLQVVNFVGLFIVTWNQLLPSIYIAFVWILFEGFMGGFTYVNAFYAISKHIDDLHREFAMSITVFANYLGISSSAVASIFIQDALCKHLPQACKS